MADQPARLEAATVRAEVGSNITYRYSNDPIDAEQIPTLSGPIKNLKQVSAEIRQEGSEAVASAVSSGIVDLSMSVESAKTSAEMAGSSAALAAASINRFTSIDDGIAATSGSGASNRFFSVPSQGGSFAIMYRNDQGVAVKIGSAASGESVEKLKEIINSDVDESLMGEYAYVMVDTEGRIAFGVTKSGSFDVGNTKDVGGKVSEIPRLSESVSYISSSFHPEPQFDRGDYAFAITDSESRVAIGVTHDGDLEAKGGSINKRLEALEGGSSDGKDIRKWVEGVFEVVCGGDSLTQGAGASSNPYPKQLSEILGRTVINRGVGGQTPQQIATRQGGYVNMLTISENKIPASGSVDVTSSTQSPITNQGGNNMAGTLYGVPGTLVATFSGTTRTSLKFIRETPGDDVDIDPATPFIPYLGDDEFCLNVFWYGRNAFWTGRTDFAAAKSEVKDALAAVIGNLKAVNRKFIVMSVLTDNKEAEWKGAEKYNAITSLNEELKAMYPRNFLDIRKILVRAYDPNKPQDVIDYGHDATPTSLLSDTLHLNVAGYAVVARSVYKFITNNGW